MPDANAIRAAAREVVAEMTGGAVADDEPLISSGRIDSLSILKLIARLEKKLGVSIPPSNLQPDDFENIDYIVETVERAAVAAGAVVIDNSSAFRQIEGIPLVIPEINIAAAKGKKLIANPNCTTAIALMALWPIHKRFKIKKAIISTYQAASGAGAEVSVRVC